jgi:hypothetical protein
MCRPGPLTAILQLPYVRPTNEGRPVVKRAVVGVTAALSLCLSSPASANDASPGWNQWFRITCQVGTTEVLYFAFGTPAGGIESCHEYFGGRLTSMRRVSFP